VSNLKPCDPEIYQNGIQVGVIGATETHNAEWIEKFVRELRKFTGQKVDWHYVGGRAQILALGDVDAVRERIRYFDSNFLVTSEKDNRWTHK
jgi:hypothetical protein